MARRRHLRTWHVRARWATAVPAWQAQGLSTAGEPFRFDQFLSDLLNGNNGVDWDNLGSLALPHSKRPPAVDFLLGPLNIVPKVRRVARPREKQEVVEQQKPVKVCRALADPVPTRLTRRSKCA